LYRYVQHQVLWAVDPLGFNVRSSGAGRNPWVGTGVDTGDTAFNEHWWKLTRGHHTRHRINHPQLGHSVDLHPTEYRETGWSLFEYAVSSPMLPPIDWPESVPDVPDIPDVKITGECNIRIYVGHGIWSLWGEDPAAQKFREDHDKDTNIITGCGNYLGLVACRSRKLNNLVDERRQIPDFPTTTLVLHSSKVMEETEKALKKAKEWQDTLCEKRKEFCDDGTAERYDSTCRDMQRCDSVTIHVVCDKDIKTLLKMGIYNKRLRPNGRVVARGRVRGLPTEESKRICGLKEKTDCLSDE
ncbi:MAG: hypothetical protein ACQESR_29350, partial [Planctomycetota bacterium]